jgi:hypothetical protein
MTHNQSQKTGRCVSPAVKFDEVNCLLSSLSADFAATAGRFIPAGRFMTALLIGGAVGS